MSVRRFSMSGRRGLAVLLLLAGPVPARAADNVVSCLLRPRHTVQLGSSVNGVLAEVEVDRGDHVRAGQELARIESSVEEATLALDRARAADTSEIEEQRTEEGMLSRKLDRTKALAGKQIASAVSLDEIQSQVDAARIKIKAAETRLATVALEAQRSAAALDLRHIKSPIDGVVMERKLEPGDYVYEQTPIMTIATVDPLTAEVIVPGNLYGRLQVGAVAEIRPASPVGGSYQGHIDAIDPVIDAASNTFAVRVVLPNPREKIPAGLRCDMSWLQN